MTAISLFSGMGGDTLGLEMAGYNVVGFSENNKSAIETHEENFGNCVHLVGKKGVNDITKIPDEVFLPYKGKVSVVFAGFPCQGFSAAGKKEPEDPRNTLFREFVRVVKIVKPEKVIGENVKGILTRKTEDGFLFKDIIIEEFKKLGYSMSCSLVKCECFGVPQMRERVIFLGKRGKEVPKIPESVTPGILPNLRDILVFSMEGAQKLPNTIDIPKMIGEGWEGKVLTDMKNTQDTNNPHPYIVSKVVEGVTVASEERWKYKGKTYENLLSFGKRTPVGLEIIDIDKPCKTVICTYDHQPRLLVILRNANGFYVRRLLIEEAKQIQGFPKDYVLKGDIKSKYKQIGNAVPPPLIKIIVES